MKAGIIAAGAGERLIKGGITTPKPLVPICGEPMIARTVRAAAELGATAVACIVNDFAPEVAGYLRAERWPVPLEVIVQTTPNSMESLFALAPSFEKEPFLLFTVDAVFLLDSARAFFAAAKRIGRAQGVLALTGQVDDERPLWVRVDSGNRIVAMGTDAGPAPFATAGFYYFRPDIFREIDAARSGNSGALREFLGLLLEKGYRLYGLPVSGTVDVDYPEDIGKAEAILQASRDGRRTKAVSRFRTPLQRSAGYLADRTDPETSRPEVCASREAD